MPDPADTRDVATIFGTGLLWGAFWFSIGFFGPMLIGGGNQGPLLGIFIMGPLGFLVGCGVGTYRLSKADQTGAGGQAAFEPWQQSALAIIAAFAVNFALGILTSLVNAPFHSFQARMLLAINGLVAGYVLARIAPRAPLAHVGGFAALQLAFIMLGSFGHLAPGGAVAVRIDGLIYALAIVVAGYLQTRTEG